jgi:thiamine pyrophosphate-dependent acetolactate synthase large subunit-like protein
LPPYGTDFAAPDFTHFAAACGIPAARATTLEAVKRHAGRALATPAPFLLDVAIDLREYEELI